MCLIKICGLFRECDADSVNQALPDYAGFVFWPKSRRCISLETAKVLKARLSPQIKTVGVFVDAPPEFITDMVHKNLIHVIQLHGNETPERIEELKKSCPNTPIWKAFLIHSPEDLQRAVCTNAHMPLLDSGYGSGKLFDHSLIAEMHRPFILAGGLTPQNLQQAIKFCSPACVDLSSGVETEGNKDPKKITEAVHIAHSLPEKKGIHYDKR